MIEILHEWSRVWNSNCPAAKGFWTYGGFRSRRINSQVRGKNTNGEAFAPPFVAPAVTLANESIKVVLKTSLEGHCSEDFPNPGIILELCCPCNGKIASR